MRALLSEFLASPASNGCEIKAGPLHPVGWAWVLAAETLSGDWAGISYICLALRSALELPTSQTANNDLAWAPASALLFLLFSFGECDSISIYEQNTIALWPTVYLDCSLFSSYISQKIFFKKCGICIEVSSETWTNKSGKLNFLQSETLT